MTLPGDDPTGETLHPAAVSLRVLLYIPQVIAVAQLLLLGLISLVSLFAPRMSPNLRDAAVPTVIALVLAMPVVLNRFVSARLFAAVPLLSRRVRQLRAGGEAVCVMTDHVRTATSPRVAGAVMTRPFIADLGHR